MLFVYILFLTVFSVFMLINLYHIIMTGSVGIVSFFVSFFMFFASFLILYLTWYLLQEINWQQTLINFSEISNFFRPSVF
ncbi:MAG: hypothetical protein A2224_02010 [Candidatus Magasanikbacteria bacterium RIFOXYA2_FULL_40_20]|nr:MAG: hypothetical protein A2224_02010 [Candidatus Magasanikbacteria bacterium RIFOXYA2_FULL_40_20]